MPTLTFFQGRLSLSQMPAFPLSISFPCLDFNTEAIVIRSLKITGKSVILLLFLFCMAHTYMMDVSYV